MSVEQLHALVDPVKELSVDEWSDEQLQASVELDRRTRPVPGHPEWTIGPMLRGPNGELAVDVYPTGAKVEVDEYGFSRRRPEGFGVHGKDLDECLALAIEYIEGERGPGIRFE